MIYLSILIILLSLFSKGFKYYLYMVGYCLLLLVTSPVIIYLLIIMLVKG